MEVSAKKDKDKESVMYFIPRNNAIYNYIAHTDIKRCYIATLFILAMFGVINFYGIYMPLIANITLLQVELAHLQKQHEDSEQLKKSNKEISISIDTNKKNIADHIVADDKKEVECSKRMQFVFDMVTKSDLALNSYGLCKENDKKWYAKDSSHIQVIGSIERILSFFKTIKDSEQMIKISHLAITRMKENTFQLSCDVGIILVKKF